MPHIIIEHSADIANSEIISLQESIHQLLKTIEGNIDPDQCKLRALSFSEYFVGYPDQLSASFIHITFKLLLGRSLEVRKALSASIVELAQVFIKNQNLKSTRCDISVDIVEMNPETYQKIRFE